MKKLTVILLLLCTIIALPQNVIYKQKEGLKKGIYRNYEEFRTNSPSSSLTVEFKKKSKAVFSLTSSEIVNFGMLTSTKELRKSIGKAYGFCDGKDIYIIPEHPNGKRPRNITKFWKVEYLGKYVYYKSILNTVTIGSTESEPLEVNHEVLNLSNGNIFPLHKDNLLLVMNNDPDLTKEFTTLKKREQRTFSQQLDFLIRYTEKNFPSK